MRKKHTLSLFSLPVLLTVALTPVSAQVQRKTRNKMPQSVEQPEIDAAFSPGQAEQKIVDLIRSTKTSLDIAAFVFTSPVIMQAVSDANKRGVIIRVVLDKRQETSQFSCLKRFSNEGISFRIDDKYAIMHNKFIVSDGATVETGSFNYTLAAANSNAENALVIKKAPAVVKAYAQEWKRLWNESHDVAKNQIKATQNACFPK